MNPAQTPLPVEKTCIACGKMKPLDDFADHPTGRFGRRPDCRDCRRTYARDRAVRLRADNNGRDGWTGRMVDDFPGIYYSVVGHKTFCTNPKVPQYKDYGGRGIEYRFEGNFKDACKLILERLGPRPPGRSLDRIDVDGHFEINNLRWATSKEQANNRRPRPTAAEWTAICAALPAAAALLAELRA